MEEADQRFSSLRVCVCAGIPMEEEEEEQDTSLKGRLMAIIYKIKGPPQKTEEPTEKEQAAPSKTLRSTTCLYHFLLDVLLLHVYIASKQAVSERKKILSH